MTVYNETAEYEEEEYEEGEIVEDDAVVEDSDCTYVQSIFAYDDSYANLLSGLSNKARELVQAYSANDSSVQFREGVESDDMFLYNQFQSAITREFRFVTIRELYAAVDESDSYGTQAEINCTSISNIISDPHIGVFKVQQLLTAPHLTERINVVSGQREYVGVGLRHRIVTLTLLAHASGINVFDDAWLDQQVECQVSCSINAEGVEDTELSGALVLADNASRKAYAGEKASFKLNALGVAYNEESLVAAAFSGRIQAGEAMGTVLSMYSEELQRKPTTFLSLGKSFYNRAKKYINSKADFVSAVKWIVDNYMVLESKFIANNDSANIARSTAKFSTDVFEAWRKANNIQEPLKADKKKKAGSSKAPQLFRRSL
jgi:hypothetical protein